MTLFVKSFVVVVAFLFIFTGCQSQQLVQSSGSHKHACAAACECVVCEKGQAGETAWCDSCNIGYVDGHKVKCRHCFEGVSGKKDVWCVSCKAGYLKGKKVDCKECCDKGKVCESCQSGSHKHACAAVCACVVCEKGQSGETAWCNSCNIGYVDGHKVACRHCFEGATGKRNVWCVACRTGYLQGKKIDCKECCHKGKACESCQI